MKHKVLIIAGRFPPYDNPGARRPAGLYKYLPDYGWEPWVITVDPQKGPNPYAYQPNDRVTVETNNVIRTGYSTIFQLPRSALTKALTVRGSHRTPPVSKSVAVSDAANPLMTGDSSGTRKGLRRGMRSAGRLGQDLLVFPDTFFGWYPHALRAAKRLHAEVTFDAIISTSGPVTSHLVASRLKRQYPDLVWIADYRDLWSQKVSREQSVFFQRLDARLEQRTLKNADAITAVSGSFSDKLSRLSPVVPTRVIYNGYDTSDYEQPSIRPTVDRLVITHAGIIYPGFRDPLPVLEALATLITQGKIDHEKIEIRFFGYTADWLHNAISELALDNCVTVRGRIPRTQILPRLMESTVLWVLDWEDQNETGNIPAKVFEYMGCRRFILASGGTNRSEIAQLLQQTGIGLHVTNEQEDIELALYKLYERYQHGGYEGFTVCPEATEAFTQTRMTQEFGSLLDNLINQ